MAAESRVIKKCPNRRLYDTVTSSYIKLNDVKKLVLEQVAFRIVDAKTNEDLTHSILLQIIVEEKTAASPIFSAELLSQIIPQPLCALTDPDLGKSPSAAPTQVVHKIGKAAATKNI